MIVVGVVSICFKLNFEECDMYGQTLHLRFSFYLTAFKCILDIHYHSFAALVDFMADKRNLLANSRNRHVTSKVMRHSVKVQVSSSLLSTQEAVAELEGNQIPFRYLDSIEI